MPKSHVVSTPAMAVPTTLPTAPTAIAMTIETTAMPRVPIALARMTRPRLGTSVNVVRPVRWLHSLVIERIAIIGSTTAIGKPMAAAKLSYVSASSGANRIVAHGRDHRQDADARHQPEARAGVEHLAQLDPGDGRRA